MTRRMTSRNVALTAAFLALAAGGAAACDSSAEDEWGIDDTSTYTYDSSGDEDYVDEEDAEEDGGEVFYCADADGDIVDEKLCADDGSAAYFLWHSPFYARGLRPGTALLGGERFRANDTAARRAFALPSAGKVSNGSVKTNVVGRGSGGSGISGSSGG
ncbi:hypothetical protein [Actinoplanes sp. NPDC049118]|uniref:hypothetical protein n=1 Tax=Actinoplanes sp. NPDC049118 TaxID=3155769 RepID=UPI0033D03DC0